MLGVLTLLSLRVEQGIHPYFEKNADQIKQCWAKGRIDAEKSNDKNGFLERIRKGLGDDGFVFLWTPRSLAYAYGFDSRKELVDEETSDSWQSTLFGEGVVKPLRLSVSGYLCDFPKLTSSGVEYARTDYIDNVRVALKVGENIYAAEKQPGTPKNESLDGEGRVVFPQITEGQEPRLGVARSYYGASIHRGMFYGADREWILGRFYCTLSLYNEDGTPRITSADKNFQIIVRYGASEKKVTYTLADWEKKGY